MSGGSADMEDDIRTVAEWALHANDSHVVAAAERLLNELALYDEPGNSELSEP